MISDDLKRIFEEDDGGLLETPEKTEKLTSTDRLKRSFVEILAFYEEHGRIPSSVTRDIAERKLGARLDGIMADQDKVALLKHLDERGLLDPPAAPESLDDLLESNDLDLVDDALGLFDTSDLPTRKQRNNPDEVAQRVKCEDFDQFEPLFAQKHLELASAVVKLTKFRGTRYVKEGSSFLLSGVMVFVADVGESEVVAGRTKERLRCIFENGTESSMYRQSLSTRLYEENGFEIVQAMFDSILDDDLPTGYLYVLRSLSADPQISSITNLHKIGFSRGPVEKRIANAEREPAFLMAPVEIVCSYRTYNMKTSALENLLHRVFSEVRLRVSLVGKGGRIYEPSEWYVVPLVAIDQAAELITSGDIVDYEYESTTGKLRHRR